MNNLSANRKYFNETALPKFISLLSPNSYVLDVGKSQEWHKLYKEMFKHFSYKTIDRNRLLEPDIVLNVEQINSWVNKVDAIIVMGCTEQAGNPFNLVRGVYHLLKSGGLVLFGIVSVAYPIYSTDLTRFTPAGSKNLLKDFKILESHIVGGEENPEYLFYICRKE